MEEKLMAAIVRLLCSLAVVLMALGTGRADTQPGNTEAPKHFPQEIVTAWKEAGAKVGWIRAEKYSLFNPSPFLSDPFPLDGYFLFVPEEAGKPGDLPAFSLAGWEPGRLAKLPVPATAFGLVLRFTPVTDAALKELAGLSGLQTLDLSRTEMTYAGLKELRELKSLQELGLGQTEVTNTGLNAIGELKSLRGLNLFNNSGNLTACRRCTWAIPR
jgi:hypothetical protein